MQDPVDKLLSRFDKENEAIRKSKASSDLDGGRRERRDGIRPLMNVVTNQITQRLPNIHHDPHQFSEVVAIKIVCRMYIKINGRFTEFFLSPHSQKALASTSWMDGDGSGSAHTTRFELPMDMKTLEGIACNHLMATISNFFNVFLTLFVFRNVSTGVPSETLYHQLKENGSL